MTGFAHRRPRADSIASFTYFQDDNESPEGSVDQAIIDDEGEEPELGKQLEEELRYDLGSSLTSPHRRKSSGFSIASIEDHLLDRYDSTKTDASGFAHGTRISQKIYVFTEDLTVVVAGFSTTPIWFLIYIGFCIVSLGLGYLLLRWLPRWRVQLIGTPKSLRECDWVVVEVTCPCCRTTLKVTADANQNQWGEFTTQNIVKAPYGYAASTVFGMKEKKRHSLEYNEDDDPVMSYLHFLDYRYIRFCFHPLKDRFVLCSDWKDPNWTDVKSVRLGLGSDERHMREQVFGWNEIDIQQKSIPRLLVDEVSIVLRHRPRDKNLNSCRRFTRSISSRSQVLYFGLLTNTITMQFASFLYLLLALQQH